VTTPQEPTPARIVPFRQPRRRAAATRQPIASPETTATDGDALADQLLRISTVTDPLPGEEDQVHHLRAVRLGASSGAFYPHTLTEDVPRAASRIGISAIELMLQTAGEYDPAFVRSVAANARTAGVSVHSVHSLTRLHPFLDPYPRRVDEAWARFHEAIDACVTLGAGVLVWHGPHRSEVATEAGWERFIALTRDLAAACGEAGITLGIENVSYGALALVRNVVSIATRLEEIGSPAEIGFVFDPFQAAEAGANPFMMLAAMGNRIVNVHVSDYREHDPAARHLLPGDGDLPWSALLRAIAGSGYSGPIMIEGPLGSDATGLGRVRETLDPLIRSVFTFEPDANRGDGRAAPAAMAAPDGVLRGIALFNQRQFYEQHEAIEAEWHAERGPVRRLYQGLLQIGIGFHHALNGNYQGAVSLLADGIAKTAEFQPQALGIDTDRLVAESRSCLERLRALGPGGIAGFDRASIPSITFIGG
jgi:sugar phosphate isomerase/epimerase